MSAGSETINVALAQISPIWLDREATLDKVAEKIEQAGKQNADLVVFGEALVPGYPFWLDLTGGARFNSPLQKQIHAHYLRNAVSIENGDLDRITTIAENHEISIYLGVIERPADRGGHSLYCSLVYIGGDGSIGSVHRKMMPTHEERLAWSVGDGHGLRTHKLGPFSVGGLNCWENWMPLARSALYAQGENLHVAVWPGSERNTSDITRFIAKESRSFVVSVSAVMNTSDLTDDFPGAAELKQSVESDTWLADGGSCIAAPDGSWVVEPFTKREDLVIAEIDYGRVLEERQNFDPSGHYSRPDILRLHIDRRRQSVLDIEE